MRKTAAFAVLLTAYAASPYVSLYEIGQDVRQQNIRALTADVDWGRLREGLKEDIADGITGVPGQAAVTAAAVTQDNDDLPPFGSGFVNNMAGNMVDETVTPQHLASTVGTLRAAGAAHMVVSRAFFTSPTSFLVALRMDEARSRSPAVKLRLDLVRSGMGLSWKVTRAWVPEEMLAASEAHSS
jgi:hypothetical protein